MTAPFRNSKGVDRDAALAAWWLGAPGRGLLHAESELLGEALEDVFGWELLQVGAWGAGHEAQRRTHEQTITGPAHRLAHPFRTLMTPRRSTCSRLFGRLFSSVGPRAKVGSRRAP